MYCFISLQKYPGTIHYITECYFLLKLNFSFFSNIYKVANLEEKDTILMI